MRPYPFEKESCITFFEIASLLRFSLYFLLQKWMRKRMFFDNIKGFADFVVTYFYLKRGRRYNKLNVFST